MVRVSGVYWFLSPGFECVYSSLSVSSCRFMLTWDVHTYSTPVHDMIDIGSELN